ncbi:cell surface protein [Companilactobacillus sp. RD055328]|uniref:WxL domain-containing protein n=1 Tax=Companilactobacillus sp. RD055328 TaxID=2916634 RepID=UPI001FC8B456|nr:WxL domain-containing protein [Companilactobacillus sp. RD055328]GKQ43331.1 cell surface protein [Companilactobacillus sp. RD055328]
MTIVKLSSLVLLTGVALMGTSSAIAAEVGSLDTNLSATFIEDTSENTPLDPTDPTKPVDPGRPGTGGVLSLDVAPISIDFGTTMLEAGANQTIFAKPMVVKSEGDLDKEVPHYVQVTDKRGGRLGWKLSVKQEAQLKSGADDLTGAIISIQDQSIVSPSAEVAPTGFTGKLDLTPGSDVPVMTAVSGQGYLTWIQKYGAITDDGSGTANENKGVQLYVPSGAAQAKAYTGSLVWSLSDTPA